jgi:hypothetical protein
MTLKMDMTRSGAAPRAQSPFRQTVVNAGNRRDREVEMRLLPALIGCCASMMVLAALGAPATAQNNFPWCANFADGAGINCGFSSYEQCMATARGSGGSCSENDMYAGPKAARSNAAAPAQRQARKHHDKNS